MGNQVVTMTFDAQTAKFVSDVTKAKEALQAAGNAGSDAGEKIASAGEKAMAATAKMSQGSQAAEVSISSLTAGWLSAGSAVTAVAALWNEHLEKMKQKADALRQSNEQLIKSLAPSGQAGEMPEVRSKLNTIQSTVFAQQDVRDIYSKISQRGGAEFSTDEKLAATRQAVRAGAAGHEDTAGFGENFLQIQKQMKAGGIKMKDNEIGSLVAQMMKSKPGGMDEQDMRLLAHDNDKFRALDLIAARGRSKEGAKAVNALEQEALEEPSGELQEKARKHHNKLTDEDRRKLRLGQISEGDRIGAMLNDPSLIPERQRLLVANLQRNMKRGEFRDAAHGDVLGNELEDIHQLRNTDGETDQAYRARELDVRSRNLTERNKRAALFKENQVKERQVENAEVTGMDEGKGADAMAAMGKMKDAFLRMIGLQEKTNEHLEDIKAHARNNSRGGAALGHPNEDK